MRLAASNLVANAVTAVHTVAVGKRAILTLSVCNRGAALATVRVALTAGGAPTDADWIEYDTQLLGGGVGNVLERTGIALGAGQKLYVQSSQNNVSAVVYGIEETV